MRRFALLCVLCLLTASCGRLVRVELQPVDAQPVPAPEETRVYAADGSQIATFRLAHRVAVERDDIPQVLVDAVVAAEDRAFFVHRGVDWRAIIRAAVANKRAGKVVQGGSTITQQLVKNRYFPHPEDTFDRKIAEAQLSRELEASATKDEILTDYLNTAYLGAGAYGIEAAAQTYFGVRTGELSLPQAALLAGLLRAPERASPYEHPERALAERRRVLEAMADEGKLDAAALRSALTSPLGVRPPPAPPVTRYPWFVEHVKRTLLDDPAFGPDRESRVRRLFGGGLRVRTTLDPKVQAAAERAARAFLTDPGDPDVGIAVVRPADGHVVAAVGGRDFATQAFDVATQARRQPGSTFKTFALAAALRDGMRLQDTIDGGSALLRVPGDSEPWRVRSGGGGLVDLRTATAKSSNGAFARLALRLGGGRIAGQAQALGITSDVGENPGIVLGGLREGVSPLEMASAYGSLANAGLHVPATPIAEVTDADGAVVWRADRSPRVGVDPVTAWYTTQALRAVVEEGTGQAARLDRPAAGKTGTTQEYTDAWFVGYTPQLSAAVWVGHRDGARPLGRVQGVFPVEGGTWPARIWKVLMDDALAGEPVLEFPYPQAYEETVLVDQTNGYLAGPWCPLVVERSALPPELPTQVCPVHGPPVETATVQPSPGAGQAPPAPGPPPGPPAPSPAPPSDVGAQTPPATPPANPPAPRPAPSGLAGVRGGG